MFLPEVNTISVEKLAGLFEKMSESYKIFWFQAIVDKIHQGRTQITFSELIDNMIADAWYMVSEYKLNLGPSDTLENLVLYIYSLGELKAGENKETILKYLKESENKIIRSKKTVLTYNVPYRLQAPFLSDVDSTDWKSTSNIIAKINLCNEVMYQIEDNLGGRSGLDKKIYIMPMWQEYIEKNYAIIKGWIQYHLINYLQKRNPNVPGIASKLYAPKARNLTKVQAYWKAVIKMSPVRNIYNGTYMTEEDISIDHFIPWSYVAHDELWNLIPTSKSVNSSKGNSLPDWELYFPKLCQVQYEALRTARRYERIAAYFQKCQKDHVNSDEIRGRMYKEKIEREMFAKVLAEVMEPVYKSAKNMGFGEWVY